MTTPRPPRGAGAWCDPRVLAALLFLAVLGLFLPAASHGFITYDDPVYVTENPHVRGGITWAGLRWAFRSTEASNWHPLTWVSHMLDCQLFGLSPWGHHLTSALLHAASAAVLFAALRAMTGATGRSLLVAALFGVHPLHVESVAWVSERKDVLGGFFWMLSLWAYAHRAAPGGSGPRRGSRCLALAFAAFALGLLCKPTLVTLPCVLLLLDYWPLGRWSAATAPVRRALVLEKLPFFAASAAACAATLLAQGRGGAVASLEEFPLAARLGGAAIAYCRYLGKCFVPSGLSVFYPSSAQTPPPGEVLLAGLLLAAISAAALAGARRRPYLIVGWLWFLGTLVPVIGLVQVGGQSIADRYTYLPLIGVFVAVVWGAEEACRGRLGGRLAPVLAAASAAALAALSARQLAFWADGTRLFEHALAVTGGDNWVAHANLSATYAKTSPDKAGAEYRETVRILAAMAEAHGRRGLELEKSPGRAPEAIREFRRAALILPSLPGPHRDLARALARAGRLPEAVAEFREAARLEPGSPEAHYNLGTALIGLPGGAAEAIGELREAIRLDPGFTLAHYNLGLLLAGIPGRSAEAIAELEAALLARPDLAGAREAIARLRGAPGP